MRPKSPLLEKNTDFWLKSRVQGQQQWNMQMTEIFVRTPLLVEDSFCEDLMSATPQDTTIYSVTHRSKFPPEMWARISEQWAT